MLCLDQLQCRYIESQWCRQSSPCLLCSPPAPSLYWLNLATAGRHSSPLLCWLQCYHDVCVLHPCVTQWGQVACMHLCSGYVVCMCHVTQKLSPGTKIIMALPQITLHSISFWGLLLVMFNSTSQFCDLLLLSDTRVALWSHWSQVCVTHSDCDSSELSSGCSVVRLQPLKQKLPWLLIYTPVYNGWAVGINKSGKTNQK